MTPTKIELRRLAFTSPTAPTAELTFEPGLNIVYGASNTGKSFTVKALNFMFGGSAPLPGTTERQPYDGIVLNLLQPDGNEVTLYRSTAGGSFELFDGFEAERPQNRAGKALNEKHQARSTNSLSYYLLNALGVTDKKVVKNASTGEQENLTFRSLARYLFVEEGPIMDERSPILSDQKNKQTADKNIFKVILTGRDDAGVVPVPSRDTLRARAHGKLELLDELIASLDEELGDDGDERERLSKRETELLADLESIEATLQQRQIELDEAISRRRANVDRLENAQDHRNELELTLDRFARLDAVYGSDIERLEALEEGGFLLFARAGRACPTCGARPEDQTHTHDAEEIERARASAAAELQKVRRERADLASTVTSLTAESDGLARRIEQLTKLRDESDKLIATLRPQEAQMRQTFTSIAEKLEVLHDKLDLFSRRDRLNVRRSQISSNQDRANPPSLIVGIDGVTGHAFAQVVQRVLHAWQFPGDPIVSFDLEQQDLRLNGKERAANGKGVRALLHAALKVAVLIFCRENNLPHPGFLVLDTPLLTYREPLKQPKHGDLSPDERAIKATSLDERFYSHLASLKELGQIIVLENSDPPASALDIAHVTVFTGEDDNGRFGFFPVTTTTPV
jgi:hypothetical protein